jgi:hypothetical protein
VDFEITHLIAAPAETVAEALLDEEYQHSLHDIGALHERELLSQEDKGKTVVRRVRCVLDLELNSTVRRLVGDGDPAWIEESTWHPDEMRWEWDIHPEIGGELLSAKGTVVLEQEDGKTARHVRGHVKVRVPLYGGKVEGWIVDGLEAAYAEEADRLTEWIEREKA